MHSVASCARATRARRTMNVRACSARDTRKSIANKGFSGPMRCDARVAQARGATEMLDRKRWFLSDCQVLLHYLGVVKALNTFELLDRVAVEAMHEVVQPARQRGRHQVLSGLLMRGVPEQERRDCQPGSPRPEGVVEGDGVFKGRSHA